jgi:3-dehydroquinate dehydratase-2
MNSGLMVQQVPKILIGSGVNLDLLGKRQKDIYGDQDLKSIETLLVSHSQSMATGCGFSGCQLSFFQTNDEGRLIEEISKPWDGAVLNLGAWTHTSLAIADRLVGVQLPFVEVHISNLSRRESFRHHSYCATHAKGVIFGFGIDSYLLGLLGILRALSKLTSTSA